MNAKQIRNQFLDFFKKKEHQIVASSPIVNHNDPSLMFTNAGMNQFKDFFLGNDTPAHPRIADTQKCLRVSGKHNDLEEVGIDSYHQTMFEMLGNWSIGDYFKNEAIDWAWELLVEVFGIDPGRLYATVFEGDQKDGLAPDEEAFDFWTKHLPQDHILYFDRKDNFWEMGETGPCGPCSELHVDLRSDEERQQKSGAELVNQDDPLVIEIWNLVFIQFNRKANGDLEELPAKHVDTGMGFERLCMVLQGKQSNYETDLFRPHIAFIEDEVGITYANSYDLSAKSDIAMRVVADHIRAVCMTIADGALPSNTGVGYVVRRILRRAVRYYYSFLNRKEPLLHLLVRRLADDFSEVFPELKKQEDFITKLVLEEEKSFLRTLAAGLKRIENINVENGQLDGQTVFELYDTYGFPADLTRLLASEKGWTIDEEGFETALNAQKQRGRKDAKKQTGDWTVVRDSKEQVEFVGYDGLMLEEMHIVKYREVASKDKVERQLVLDRTPFYPEGGGQVGDTGILKFADELIHVLDTIKENDLIIHKVDQFPNQVDVAAIGQVNADKRKETEYNHSATHLLHAALRDVLGTHVAQKGSLVNENYLRFDFSHFQKMTEAEIKRVEEIVNQKIQQNIRKKEDRNIPIEQAKEAGAMMLFGEKYGEEVRMITFDPTYSVELCGGCHVVSTGQIGLFKITQETSVAAGVRRIEAVTGAKARSYVDGKLDLLKQLEQLMKNPADAVKQLEQLQNDNKRMQKELEQWKAKAAEQIKDDLLKKVQTQGDYKILVEEVPISDGKQLKQLVFHLAQQLDNLVVVLGSKTAEKATIMVAIDKAIAGTDPLHAGNVIKKISGHISGGGGGQAFFASAGGKNPNGLEAALTEARALLS